MEHSLITLDFNVPARFFTYPAKFIAPAWGQGFQCQGGECGLCCLTELPDAVPRIHNYNIDQAICGFFDSKNKLCKEYIRRPQTCKTYPFFFGVEEGTILISASLECPGTNSNKIIPTEVLSELFEEPSANKTVTFLNDCYEQAILRHDLWADANRIWQIIKERVKYYFMQVTNFPFSQSVSQMMFDILAEAYNQKPIRVHRTRWLT